MHTMMAFTSLPAVLPRKTSPHMTATTGKQPSSPPVAQTDRRKLAKPSPPLESLVLRPELIGALPLWLLSSAAQQVRRVAARFSEAQAAKKLPVPVEDSTPVGEVLRDVARSVESELAHTRALLAAKDVELCQLRLERERLEQKLSTETGKLYNVEQERETLQLRLTAAQLRLLVSSEQTKAAAAEKKLKRVLEMVRVLEGEREEVKQDVVKMSLLGMGLVVAVVSFVLRSPISEGMVRSLLAGAM